MAQILTIGGNRLGSGRKMKTAINDYARSNQNLSTKFTASTACGLLYPCLGLIGNRGDTFKINLRAAARTLPTLGPLFGSYKLQVDLFQCDFRLYQALLHNNPLAIGLQMNQVKLPKIRVETYKNDLHPFNEEWGKFSNSCLQKYLGMSGIGTPVEDSHDSFYRQYLAIPTLAYYDVFKNYYANKQEGIGYVVTPTRKQMGFTYPVIFETMPTAKYSMMYNKTAAKVMEDGATEIYYIAVSDNFDERCIEIKCENPEHLVKVNWLDQINETSIERYIETNDLGQKVLKLVIDVDELANELFNDSGFNVKFEVQTNRRKIGTPQTAPQDVIIGEKNGLTLTEFDLANIDDMRYQILSQHTLGSSYLINLQNEYPYKANYETLSDNVYENDYTANKCEHVGLVTKCYQNDIFNNWLRREWIDGENSIAEVTKIAVTDNAFKIDSLILGEALYNMLNRVALSDATYYSWLSVTYTDNGARHIESPVYVGGLSGEVMFEEIVQTSPGDGDPLGTLGGRGILKEGNGGHVVIKCTEPCFILGIISLTPRIMYTQGNEWYNTELDSIDDLHKPELDAIAFQNLLGERMAWWDTKLGYNGTIIERSVIGKLPAWIHYCTNFDRAYGDMAGERGAGYMILNRNYERDETDGTIKDATSYIDPTKYNYAFAKTSLDSQNFWMQVQFDIEERWLGSAHQIPNA